MSKGLGNNPPMSHWRTASPFFERPKRLDLFNLWHVRVRRTEARPMAIVTFLMKSSLQTREIRFNTHITGIAIADKGRTARDEFKDSNVRRIKSDKKESVQCK
jgi:hypothetical protein